MELTIDNIRTALGTLTEDQLEYDVFGLRVDTGAEYKIGDVCNESRQLYQDPISDYDGGELDGTYCVSLGKLSDSDIKQAVAILNCYFGETVHLITGEEYECGEDYYNREIIIRNAKVVGIFKRTK